MSPFSQLLGLSLVVHLSVIALTKKFGGRGYLRRRRHLRYNKLICLSIIGTIFGVVFFGASVIVVASVMDPYSNIHVVMGLLQYAGDHFQQAAHAGWQSAKPSDLLSVAVPLPLAAATIAIRKMGKR